MNDEYGDEDIGICSPVILTPMSDINQSMGLERELRLSNQPRRDDERL